MLDNLIIHWSSLKRMLRTNVEINENILAKLVTIEVITFNLVKCLSYMEELMRILIPYPHYIFDLSSST